LSPSQLWLTAICCAQVATGNLRGSVSDSTGCVLPNCSVTITHISTGLVPKVVTNEQGDFNAPSLPVGEYRIAIGLAGFQTKILSGLALQVDQTAIVPVVLEPGAVTQTMEVTAQAPDQSEKRLCEVRCLGLLDDMNNWAGPKYMIAEGDTYMKYPDDETFPQLVVNYVKMEPGPEIQRRLDFGGGYVACRRLLCLER
jgi:hypothetical protein